MKLNDLRPHSANRKSSGIRLNAPTVTLSVVSHGQGRLVENFLSDLRDGVDVDYEIILTLNIPEDEGFIDKFRDLPISIIRNAKPKGFGANHNAAFAHSKGSYFAVVNPDIRVKKLSLTPIISELNAPGVGASGPAVYSSKGKLEDNARRFPTLPILVRRRLSRELRPDYIWSEKPIEVDWIAGMFVVFQAHSFAAVAGFDERYFMYLEDADICRRLRAKGFKTVLQPNVQVVHDAQRASRRSFRHIKWHATSAVRYFTGL